MSLQDLGFRPGVAAWLLCAGDLQNLLDTWDQAGDLGLSVADVKSVSFL